MLLYLAFGLLGVLAAYWPTWASGFARMQSERSDSLHIHYVLEHQFRHLVGSGSGTYWSPAYFHPVRGGLAYSENLLATLPVYSATRLLFDRATSFQIWGMAMLVANFAAMLWALRRLGARPWVAAGGAFVFAFALPRVAHLNHQHMLPHFAAPIAICAALLWFERPTLRAWAALWVALGVQILAALHLGWFLALALAIWTPLRFVLEPAAWRRQGAWLRSHGWSATATVVAVAAVVAALLAPYAAARSAHGTRDDGQVTILAPRWTSWFAAPSGTLASAVGLQSDPKSPFYWEHELFTGFALLAAAALALLTARRLSSHATSIRALILAGFALVALSLYWPLRPPGPGLALRDLGFTLWWWVWDWVPGASSMRAVGRVWSGVLPLLVVGGFLGLEALAARLANALAALAGAPPRPARRRRTAALRSTELRQGAPPAAGREVARADSGRLPRRLFCDPRH